MLNYVSVVKREKEQSSLPLHAYITTVGISEFKSFCGVSGLGKKQNLAENDPNWKFWMNFVFRDLFS